MHVAYMQTYTIHALYTCRHACIYNTCMYTYNTDVHTCMYACIHIHSYIQTHQVIPANSFMFVPSVHLYRPNLHRQDRQGIAEYDAIQVEASPFVIRVVPVGVVDVSQAPRSLPARATQRRHVSCGSRQDHNTCHYYKHTCQMIRPEINTAPSRVSLHARGRLRRFTPYHPPHLVMSVRVSLCQDASSSGSYGELCLPTFTLYLGPTAHFVFHIIYICT